MTKSLPITKPFNINSHSEHELCSIQRFNATFGWLHTSFGSSTKIQMTDINSSYHSYSWTPHKFTSFHSFTCMIKISVLAFPHLKGEAVRSTVSMSPGDCGHHCWLPAFFLFFFFTNQFYQGKQGTQLKILTFSLAFRNGHWIHSWPLNNVEVRGANAPST